MYSPTHRKVTTKAFEFLRDIDGDHPLLQWRETIIDEAGKVDKYTDVEFVDVEGLKNTGRDNPHDPDEKWTIEDEPHYETRDNSLTAYNHFIDVKKGDGRFDDYDGYSYERGSASSQQYETIGELADTRAGLPVAEGLILAIPLISNIALSMKVDYGFNGWWFNDEYVHAPGQSYYQNCSPAVERYSFPQDRGIYSNKEAELTERFPLAEWHGESSKGIPYSVFMPVDNLARYWYWYFLKTHNVNALGPVMHAIQDTSVPHHAAGYFGNYHARYENDLEKLINSWIDSSTNFEREVKDFYAKWNRLDNSSPSHLKVSEWAKVPAINWSIDQLVTWVALNAYKEYDKTYNQFSNGYHFNENSAKELTKLATAMCLLVLKKTSQVGLIEALHNVGKKPPISIKKAFPSDAKSLRARIGIAPINYPSLYLPLPVYYD